MAIKPHAKIPNAWIIRWRTGGRNSKYEYLTIYDCDEAHARATEMKMRQRGAIHNAVNPQLRHVLPEWISWMRLHRAPKTVESILWALKHLEPHFGLYTVPMITEHVVDQYKEKRKGTPRSCNLELDYLKSCISWMVERKLCLPLPFKIQRLPYRDPIPRIPSPDDLGRWLDAMEGDGPYNNITKRRDPGPKNAIIWIMVRCGLRFHEATGLRWNDIDWNQGVIYYTSKGGRRRLSVLPDEARQILEPLRPKAAKDQGAYLAPNPKTGEPYGHMKTLFKTAAERSGVEIKGPHTLRHICATYTLSATGDLRLVQATLGHTQIRTTEKYTHIDIDRIRRGQEATVHLVQKKVDKNK